MTTAHWRQEVVDAAATISKSLGISLSFAGSMGTGSIGDGIVARSLETVSSLLGRGDEKWNSWFQDHISRPLAALFADPKPGFLCEPLRLGHTREEEQKRGQEIKDHCDKLWEPFWSILEALDFFIIDFPRGLGPPVESAQASRFGKGGAKTMGLDDLLIKYPNVKEGGSGPVAVLRVLLKDHQILWSQNELAKSGILKDAIPSEKASASSVGRWLKILASEELAQSSGTKTAKRWQAGVNCWK